MNLTDNETLKFMRGSPVLLDDICAIYSPKLGEIVDIGYDKFQQYLGILTMTKPISRPGPKKDQDLAQMLENLTDYEYFILMTTLDKEVNLVVKQAFKFFIHESVTFSIDPAQIMVGPLAEQHILNEEKFYDFQRILKRMCFVEVEGEEIIINPDDSPTVRRLKMQMRENREKVRRANAKQAQREKSDLKFSDLIGSMTLNNCGLNIDNIWNITYYAFHDQLKRMGWRDQFNINNQAAMAGAKLKKSQLKHWMRPIADSDKT